jgi:hypothetical protein
MSDGSNTPEAAGHALVKLALGQIRPPSGRIYASLRSGIITWPDPSAVHEFLRFQIKDHRTDDSLAVQANPS